MEIHTRSKSSLFLTEMIISVLFFSIAAACCIQIFVRAHFVSQNSENLNYAQNLASGMVESMMASDGEYSEIRQYFPTADINGNTITVYMTNTGLPVKKKMPFTYFEPPSNRRLTPYPAGFWYQVL